MTPQACLTTLPENSQSQESGQNFRATPGLGGYTGTMAIAEACSTSLIHLHVTALKNLSSSAYGTQGERLLGLSFGRTHQHLPRDQQGLAERSEVSSGFLLQRKESPRPDRLSQYTEVEAPGLHLDPSSVHWRMRGSKRGRGPG